MIYLDHAATTYVYEEVANLMFEILVKESGNPSSTHQTGQSAKALVENSRKTIAKGLDVTSSEIIFTSSGTESINWILINAVENLGVNRIISTKIEHHAVLHTLEYLEKKHNISIEYLSLNENGAINLSDLNEKLSMPIKTLVSLMHINNEIGTILNLEDVSKICIQNNALLHSDMVQSMGKIPINLKEIPIDFVSASAHKFHGPKGIGFLYASKKHSLSKLFHGGSQEKGLRAGTEATHQIVGMAKAFEISLLKMDENLKKISELREYTCNQLKQNFSEVKILGNYDNSHIINVILPFDSQKASMLTFTLNLKGIAVSRGSACQSGSVKPSHVLDAILSIEDKKLPNLRISFAPNNTLEEIENLMEVLRNI